MTLFKLTVTEKSPKQLGAFLMKNGFSKRAVTNAKHNGGMLLVNHKRRYSNYRMKVGDQVILVTGKEKLNEWLKASFQPVDVVLETANYLLVNKPAGILSIPSRQDDDALVNRLMGYFAKNGQTESKPHIVTRLDRDTSGLVLVGSNAIAHARLGEISKEEFVKKYRAIVHGNFADDELTGIIDAPIGKKDASVKRYVLPSGKAARTAYQVLDQVPGASLVELRLYSGRTHQIRVHMQHIGHPLFGDWLYGVEDDFTRQALHCCYLSFPDPFNKGQQVQVTAVAPKDMLQLWETLQN